MRNGLTPRNKTSNWWFPWRGPKPGFISTFPEHQQHLSFVRRPAELRSGAGPGELLRIHRGGGDDQLEILGS